MLVALCSVKGSPGVTTLAVALAGHWPEAAQTRRLIAELDPSGGDLAMRFGISPARGLVSLAAVARRTGDPAVVWEHAQALTGGACVLAAPPGGPHARAALHALATAPGGPLLDSVARHRGVVVLADCGRVDPGSPAEAVARRADALVLVTGTHGDDLAHLAPRLSELALWTPRPGLLLTGSGYRTGDVERELGVPAIGRIPHDMTAALAVTGRPPQPTWRRGGGLSRSVAALARALSIPPQQAPRSPPRPASGAVPGVSAQQARQRCGEPPGPCARPSAMAPQVTDPRSNGHQPIKNAGKEPPT